MTAEREILDLQIKLHLETDDDYKTLERLMIKRQYLDAKAKARILAGYKTGQTV